MSGHWRKSRNLVERIVVTGKLTLQTPTHFGNGNGNEVLDMPLHLDEVEGKALLTGSSLAGALRSYLHQYNARLAQRLFGDVYVVEGEENRSEESMVIIDDAFADITAVELRDGVTINPTTCTAEDDKKFDIELLAAGTTFDLSLELLIRDGDNRVEFLQAFALGLTALAEGGIRLGKRKRRGFGQCTLDNWKVQRFHMRSPEGLIAWLEYDPFSPSSNTVENQSLFVLLDVPEIALLEPLFRLAATFRLDGSLLIRSAPDESSSADHVHLQSPRPYHGNTSVLSGTSVGGALRARALRIVNTIKANGNGVQFVDNLFGYRTKSKNDETELWASRLWVDETVVQEPIRLVQNRVKIDRFTGGSFPGALFSEEAVFGGEQTKIKIQLTLGKATNRQTKDNPNGSNDAAEIGLLLMLLKDLWTGDLPLGGESSIGRGRLCGESATIHINNNVWEFHATDSQKLTPVQGDLDSLEFYAEQFVGAMA